MNELISVIVPVYNAEKYLKLCISSLIAQSYKNIEIILVNDGSKDNSLKICNYYSSIDSRIRVIDKKNTGVSDTRNIGIKESTGDYVMFCDSDDCVSPYWCEHMLSSVKTDNLVMCQIKKINSEDIESVAQFGNNKTEVKDKQVINKSDFIFYRDDGICSPTNKIFDVKVINKYNIHFPVELSLGEDLAFVLQYLQHVDGNIIDVEEQLYFYRLTGQESLSKSVPTVKQCEFFYNVLNDAMVDFQVTDSEAWKLRNNIIMYDFEKILIKTMNDKKINLFQKYLIIRNTMRTPAYRNCCKLSYITENIFYQLILRKRYAFFYILFFILTN